MCFYADLQFDAKYTLTNYMDRTESKNRKDKEVQNYIFYIQFSRCCPYSSYRALINYKLCIERASNFLNKKKIKQYQRQTIFCFLKLKCIQLRT